MRTPSRHFRGVDESVQRKETSVLELVMRNIFHLSIPSKLISVDCISVRSFMTQLRRGEQEEI
jgi:hypothetical protein